MLAASRLRRRGSRADYWPGFVDLMSTLLLVMIFLLVVYMLAQYFLQRTLSEETEAKDDLNAKLNSLDEKLASSSRPMRSSGSTSPSSRTSFSPRSPSGTSSSPSFR